MFEKYNIILNLKDIKEFLAKIAGLIAILGLSIAIYKLSNNFFIVFIINLLIIIIWLIDRNKTISSQLEKLKSFEGYYTSVLGNYFYNQEQPRNDTQHHLTYAQEEYIVHDNDGTYRWELKGYNTLDEPSSSLIIKFNGVSQVDVSTLAFSVKDMTTGERYNDNQIKIFKDLSNLKIFIVKFPKSLAKNECFHLNISCRWNGNFPRSKENDCVFFAAGNYWSKGVDKFVGRLACDLKITTFAIERFDSGVLIPESTQPKVVVDVKSPFFILEWETSNPHYYYILKFTKKLNN